MKITFILEKRHYFSQLTGVEKPSWERNLRGNATNFKRHRLDKNQMNTIFKNLIWWQNRFVSVIIKTIVTFWCKVMSTGNNQVSRLGTVKHSKLPWNRIGRDLSFHMRINSLNAEERRQPIFFPPSKQLETSLQEAIFLLIHFLVCACLCYQVFQQLIYSLHVVSSEKKKKMAEFPQRFYDFRNHFSSTSKLYMKEWIKRLHFFHCTQVFQLLWHFLYEIVDPFWAYPRKSYPCVICGRPQFWSLSTLLNTVKLITIQERNVTYIQVSNTWHYELEVFWKKFYSMVSGI